MRRVPSLLVMFAVVFSCWIPAAAQATSRPVGSGPVIVHSRFGGQIFGFDIDQNGTEGILSEAKTISGGNVVAAVETFDQTTGNILKVLTKAQTMDDFLTLGVVGGSVGLVEHEHVLGFLKVQRTFGLVNPVSGNKFNGSWTPPIGQKTLIQALSRGQGTTNAAVLAFPTTSFSSVVFSSDVAANTFGPAITLTDSNFTQSNAPVIAYDSTNNQAVVASKGVNAFGPPDIGLIDLASGSQTVFSGLGTGYVNGLAVDPATGVACTTTEIDFSVQFYNLATHTGFSIPLPGATTQFFSGADVQVDPIHKLFLVAQPNSSTAASGSSIHVYDESGNLIESLNGFSFSNAFNVVPAHIALKPSTRSGFVDGPDQGVTELQSFTY
jgi:hypothetical protein